MSNWERYEVEETTALTVRGSDFAALLKSSGKVLHFPLFGIGILHVQCGLVNMKSFDTACEPNCIKSIMLKESTFSTVAQQTA